MSTHNVCVCGEIRKYYADTPSYLELSRDESFGTKSKQFSKKIHDFLKIMKIQQKLQTEAVLAGLPNIRDIDQMNRKKIYFS